MARKADDSLHGNQGNDSLIGKAGNGTVAGDPGGDESGSDSGYDRIIWNEDSDSESDGTKAGMGIRLVKSANAAVRGREKSFRNYFPCESLHSSAKPPRIWSVHPTVRIALARNGELRPYG